MEKTYTASVVLIRKAVAEVVGAADRLRCHRAETSITAVL